MRLRALTACVAVAGLLTATAASDAAVPGTGGGLAERPPSASTDEVIVRFDDGVGGRRRAAIRRAADTSVDRALLLEDTQLLRVQEGTAAAAARALRRMDDVLWAEPNLPVHGGAAPTNDPEYPQLWGLRSVNALPAWDASRGEGVVIAVVDSGVAGDHPDLRDNLWVNSGETPGNGVDDDGNGFVDDRRGWDFWDVDNDPDDFHTHGTHVAGTAAAVGDNGTGVVGVAHRSTIMPVRVLNDMNAGTTADIADGIVYAAENGADVINLSAGSRPGALPSRLEREALDVAQAHDAVVVVAAMNDGNDNDTAGAPVWPCNFAHSNLICVAAMDPDGGLSSFSNFGATSVDVGAPGNSILSAAPDFDRLSSPGVDDFEGDAIGRWVGTVPWARTTAFAASPTHSLTDSPAGDYANNATPHVAMAGGANLTGQRGCRVNYALRGRVLDGDRLFSGAFNSLNAPYVSSASSVDTHGEFETHSDGISAYDGDASVRAAFQLITDGSGTADGVYIDDVRFACRAATYDEADYLENFGTSMAAPHVAGVAALVRSAVPSASAVDVVEAIRSGAAPTPSLAGKTVTGARVDANAAIAAARRPKPQATPLPQQAAGDRTAPVPRAHRTVVRRGFALITVSFPGETSRVTGTVRLDSRKAPLRLGSAPYKIEPGRARALRIRLSSKARRRLARENRLRAVATIHARDTAGNESVSTRSVVLRARP